MRWAWHCFVVSVIAFTTIGRCFAEEAKQFGELLLNPDTVLSPNPWITQLDDISEHSFLKNLIVESAEYLMRIQMPNGEFHFIVDPLAYAEDLPEYSLPRHLSACRCLVGAFRVSGQLRHIRAARLCLSFSLRFALSDTTSSDMQFAPALTANNEQDHFMGGYFLIAASEYDGATLGDRYEESNIKVARHLMRSLTAGATSMLQAQGAMGLCIFANTYGGARNTVKSDASQMVEAAYSHAASLLLSQKNSGQGNHWTLMALEQCLCNSPRPDTVFQGRTATVAQYALHLAQRLVEPLLGWSTAEHSRLVGSKGYLHLHGCRAEAFSSAARIADLIVKDTESYLRWHEWLRMVVAYEMQFRWGAAAMIWEGNPDLIRLVRGFQLEGGYVAGADAPFSRLDHTTHPTLALLSLYFMHNPQYVGANGWELPVRTTPGRNKFQPLVVPSNVLTKFLMEVGWFVLYSVCVIVLAYGFSRFVRGKNAVDLTRTARME